MVPVQPGAVAADPVQFQPLLGDGESLTAGDLGAEVAESSVLELPDLSTAGADKVVMRPVGWVRVEPGIAVAKLPLGGQAGLAEQFQRAIHGDQTKSEAKRS